MRRTNVITFPNREVGKISPYPTVVNVDTTNHNESKRLFMLGSNRYRQRVNEIIIIKKMLSISSRYVSFRNIPIISNSCENNIKILMNLKNLNTNNMPASAINGSIIKSKGMAATISVQFSLNDLFLSSALKNLKKNSRNKTTHKQVSKIIKL